MHFWQKERKVSTVGKGVEGAVELRVGAVRNNGGSQGTGQQPPDSAWLTQTVSSASSRKASLMD